MEFCFYFVCLGKEAKGKGGAKGGPKGGKGKKGKGEKEDAVLPVIPVSLARTCTHTHTHTHTHYSGNTQCSVQVTGVSFDYIITGSTHSATPTPSTIAHAS